MNRRYRQVSKVKTKAVEKDEQIQATMWLLGAFPLAAMLIISYLMLPSL